MAGNIIFEPVARTGSLPPSLSREAGALDRLTRVIRGRFGASAAMILPPHTSDPARALAAAGDLTADRRPAAGEALREVTAPILGSVGEQLGQLVLRVSSDAAVDAIAADDLEDVVCLAAGILEEQAAAPTLATTAEVESAGVLFQEFLKAAPAAIAMFDTGMRFLAVSTSYRTLFGLTGEKILGRSLYDVMPDLPPEWSDQQRRCLSGQPIVVERDSIRRTGGVQKFIRRHLDPWLNKDGAIGGILSWCDDISPRVTAEAMLAENQHFLRAVLESVDEGMSACDARGHVLFRNRRLREMHDLDEEQAQKASLPAEALNLYGIGATERVPQRKSPLFRALDGERVVDERLEIRVPGRAARQILSTALPMEDANGACIGAVVSERDVTQSVESLRLLREAHARYLAIFNNTFQFCALLSPDGNVLEINNAALRMSGLSRDEVIGCRLWDLPGFARDPGLSRHVAAAFRLARGGVSHRYEVELFGAASRRVPVNCALVPVCDETGALVNVLAEARDITDVRRNEAALKQHEQELRLILNSVPSRIMVKNTRNEILRCNRAAADALGRGIADVEGINLEAIRPDLAQREWRSDLRVIAQGTMVSAAPGPDDMTEGASGWVSTTRVPFADATTGEQLVCVVTSDVTELVEAQLALRESEYQHRQMFSRTPMMLQSTDLEGALEHVSDYWCDKLGYTRAEALFRPFTDFMTTGSRERALANRAHASPPGGGTQTLHGEYEFVRSDGQVLEIELSELIEWEDEGSCNRVIGVLTDVTERRRAERDLMHMQRMESVGQLTGGLAHDFNNLLCVVQGNLELLDVSVDNDPVARRRVKAAAKAVESGAQLTRRLLTFARRQPLSRATLDLVTLVRGITDLLRRAAGEAVRIEVDAPEMKLAVNTDASQVEAALLNLTVNARDAMPDGGTLTIRAALVTFGDGEAPQQLEPGSYVCLSIIDTGEGIPPELQSRVLEPFFTTKHSGSGSGLGLSMVYGFMQQTGGAVTLSSALGEGTTINLYFRQSTDMVAVPPTTPTDEETPDTAVRDATILVVEDQAEVRVVLVEALQRLGYMTIDTGDVAEVEEVLAAFDVDLVLSDVVLPGPRNGLALARDLFETRPDLPVVMMSGNADAEAVINDRLTMLRKPFQREELARAIAEALA
ncbi:PAS domain S-box protein [Acuticoccus sp. MNP-M23]|uniref:PAS domain S-box protein n=1 Tax=Acuticoccus sp. MNP-M23 TaxID=3072793 RepID=UPI002815AF79|nr:PAS domain S-box protein [Acuticoccus sp. MNP-M23]WMS42977.1 PAS domain S-box protein [Acuticoccus sp. MNP-M23]